MELTMRMNPDPCQVLPVNDTKIFSRYMTSCDAIIVFAMPITDEYDNILYYDDVRGYHALGGIGNTNWQSLFDGFADFNMHQIFVFGGADNKTAFAMSEIVTQVENAITKFKLTSVNKHFTWLVSEVEMNNKAEITYIKTIPV